MNLIVKYKYELGVVIMTLFMMYFIFGAYLWQPNSMMMAFGGDALVLYYNTLYHACYGNGLTLENMNYPQGDLIFMTDAQSVLSLFLMGLRKLGFNTCDCAVGFIHFFNHYSLIPATLLMYYVLVRLGIRKELSVIFGVLIIFLSPQMFRFAAHYGLAYLFVIPMVLLYIIEKKTNIKSGKWDMFVLLVLILVTFNNAYLGFIGAAMGLIAGTLYTFYYYWKNRKVHNGTLVLSLVCFIALLIPFVTLQILDHVGDRLQVQWGFTTYATNLRGSLYPPNTLMHLLMTASGIKINPPEFESVQYLGIIPILILLSFVIIFPFKKNLIKVNSDVKLFIIAAFILYAYSSNVNLFGSSFIHYIEEHLGFLLMFKASGRIGWPLYYAISIFAVYLLNIYLNFFKARTNKLGFLVLTPIVIIWILEINLFVKPVYKDVFHANFLSKEKRSEYKAILEGKGFKSDEFQSLLCVPKTEFWSDKLLSYNHWPTHFYATLISLAFELPMSNALLSRPGTKNNALNTQLLSHPLIVREKPATYPDKRDILLVFGHQQSTLSEGEKYLTGASSLIYEDNDIQLRRFKFDQFFKSPAIETAKNLYLSGKIAGPLYHEGYETTNSNSVFYGNGAREISEGVHEILNKELSLSADTTLTFSIWTKLDNKKYGLGDWIVRSYNENGGLDEEVIINPRNSYDIQHDFIRSGCEIKVKRNGRINIQFIANQKFVIDELMIDYKGNDAIIDLEEKPYFLFNNYKILK